MAAGVVIAGAGPAGITVAETLRRLDPERKITLVSAEPYAPYAPPAMADYFVSGREQCLFWKGQDACERLKVAYNNGVVLESLDTESRTLSFTAGSALRYDDLVIATGSGLHAPVAGADLDGVYNFKSLSAATRLVEGVSGGSIGRVLIVGGGFIGVELSLLLRNLNVAVHIVDREAHLMHRVLDPETAAIVFDRLRARGVEVSLETEARRFVGDRRVTGVELESGEVLVADAYVAATGVKPNVDWLTGSAVRTAWGVLVDECLRCSAAHVWAAGDVAESVDRLTGERYVHAIFPNAVAQGQVVARALAGDSRPYPGAESMNSLKHLGVEVMAAGSASGDEVIRSRRGESLRKLFLKDGRIVGFRLAGDISGAGVYRSLMLRRIDVSAIRHRLLDTRHGAVWTAAASCGYAW